MNVASGACRRVASSRLSVPLALTPKSVCGSDAAQSCDGCAAVWTTSSSAARARRRPVDARRRRGCRPRASGIPGSARRSRSVTWRRRRLGAEEAGAHVVLDPDHVEAGLDEVRDRLGADQAARAGDDRGGHAVSGPFAGRRCSRARCARPARRRTSGRGPQEDQQFEQLRLCPDVVMDAVVAIHQRSTRSSTAASPRTPSTSVTHSSKCARRSTSPPLSACSSRCPIVVTGRSLSNVKRLSGTAR